MLEIGSIVDGKYKILRVVGKGGMSVVYQAVNEKANKIWAIKEVRKDGVQNYEVVKQNLIVETELLKRFNHPNLPSIIDVIDGDGTFLITLFNAENKLDGNENEDFTLEGNKSYQLRAQVVDVFGNKSEITDIKATSVTVNGEILAISPDNFEVVINKNSENISIQNLNYDFDYGKQNIYKIYKDVENGLITTTIKNELSGLHKISVRIDGTELDNKSTNLKLSFDDYSKDTSAKVTVDVSKLENRLQSGEHTIVIEAVQYISGPKGNVSKKF